MTNRQYSEMSDEQLAQAFVEISIKQADSIGLRRARTTNKLFEELRSVAETLRARGLAARTVLVPLLRYSDARSSFAKELKAQVRLNAAKELLAVVPDEARATLEELVEHGPSFQSGSAGMCLQLLDDGIFKPT